ncbi:MAG: hypothetical protein LBD52_04420, partial [Prevotellaceae bacterium]|nr:hypothetical protein [Prevotellaceae bacterium]
DATFVEFVRIPDGMRGLISCIFLPGGNPSGIISPDVIHGIFSFPPRQRHPVRDATFVEFVRIPDGMRGLISCIFLPGGNPYGIFSPDGINVNS